MAKAKSVIITCAVTGGIHTPTMSPHLPITPQQIGPGCACIAFSVADIGTTTVGGDEVHLEKLVAADEDIVEVAGGDHVVAVLGLRWLDIGNDIELTLVDDSPCVDGESQAQRGGDRAMQYGVA